MVPGRRRLCALNTSHVGTKTASDRAREYGSSVYVSGALLFCRSCEISLDHRRKSSIDSHFAGAAHKAKAEKRKRVEDGNEASSSSMPVKRQITVESSFLNNTSKKAKLDLVNDVVLTFAKADIPLEKLDNPAVRSFLNKYIPNAAAIPTANYLRRGKLEEVYLAQMAEIKPILQGAEAVSVMPDETTDAKNRPMMNIIIIPTLSSPDNPKLKPYLVETVELENVNGATVAGAVLRCIAELGIPYNKVQSFVSDNVAYMKTAFEILKAVIPTCVHVGCWAHIFSLVGDTWRHSFPVVDEFVLMMKKLFRNSRPKKALYVKVVGEQGFEKPKTPPKPVLTRWSSWLNAVSQHAEYFPAYEALLQRLQERGEETQAFTKLQELMSPEAKDELALKLRFIAVLSTKVKRAILLMERQEFAAHYIYNYAHQLLQWLRALEAKDFLPEIQGEGFSSACSKRIASEFHEAVVKCREKLSKYVLADQMTFFKEARIFDIAQVSTLSADIGAYQSIPGLQNPNDNMKEAWNIYLDSVPATPDATIKLLPFWFGMKKRVPALATVALRSLSVPISSVDVERSFSAYNHILADNRHNLKPSSLKWLTGLYFNSNCGESTIQYLEDIDVEAPTEDS